MKEIEKPYKPQLSNEKELKKHLWTYLIWLFHYFICYSLIQCMHSIWLFHFCRDLLSGGGTRKASRMGQGCVFHQRKTCGVATNVYLRKTLEKKPKDDGLRILKMRVQELFTNEEDISTPRVRHKERQPLIECAIHDFNIMYFPFLYFYFFMVDKGVSVAPIYSSIVMRKSDLRSSLRTEHLVKLFYLFWKIDLVTNKIHLRRWTFKRSFDFWKERIVKVLNPFERSLNFEWRGEPLRRWTLNGFKWPFWG